MDKYEVLYNLSMEVYKDRNQSFQHIQEKAAKYFAALTFLLGFSLYYTKWILEDLPLNLGLLNWAMIIESGVLLSFLILTWFCILRILRIENFKVLPLDDELLKFFVDNRQIDINYTMSKGIKMAIEQNNVIQEKKSGLLNIAYNLLTIDTILIVVSLILFVIKYFKQYG